MESSGCVCCVSVLAVWTDGPFRSGLLQEERPGRRADRACRNHLTSCRSTEGASGHGFVSATSPSCTALKARHPSGRLSGVEILEQARLGSGLGARHLNVSEKLSALAVLHNSRTMPRCRGTVSSRMPFPGPDGFHVGQ